MPPSEPCSQTGVEGGLVSKLKGAADLPLHISLSIFIPWLLTQQESILVLVIYCFNR